jgi:predicted metal-binding membrane protein
VDVREPERHPGVVPLLGIADPDRPRAWLAASLVAGLVAGAWVALAWLGGSPYGSHLSHGAIGGSAPFAGRAGWFVAGWTLMSVAMMLPTAWPLVSVVRTLTRGSGALLGVLVAGYLGIWALFGLVAVVADGALHGLVATTPALAAQAHRVPAALLLAAGLFQFSPLKSACLTACRSPVGFAIRHWRGRTRAARALRLGVRHGLSCVGCCWALMLLMFAAGGVHLGWMLALAALMSVEKAASWGRRVTAPAGIVLALWGLALLAGVPAVPAPF